MDGLSSDFTSASPFIARAQVSWPRVSQVDRKHATNRVLICLHRPRCVFYSPSPRMAADTVVLLSVFCLLAGKGEGARDVIAAGKARVVDLF